MSHTTPLPTLVYTITQHQAVWRTLLLRQTSLSVVSRCGCSRNSGFVELRTKKRSLSEEPFFDFWKVTLLFKRTTLLPRNYKHYNKTQQRKCAKPVFSPCSAKTVYSNRVSNKCPNFRYASLTLLTFISRVVERAKHFARAKNYIRQGQWYNVLR